MSNPKFARRTRLLIIGTMTLASWAALYLTAHALAGLAGLAVIDLLRTLAACYLGVLTVLLLEVLLRTFRRGP